MKFGVIHTDTIYHEADERSRTNPGHGYPAHSEYIEKFTSFENENELKTWIERNRNKRFKVIRYEEVSVEWNLSIK